MKHTVKDIIEEGQELINDQLDYLDKNLIQMSDEDLNWRPGIDKWNILEVVEHLNRFGDFYLPKLNNIIVYPKSLRKRDHYRSGLISEFTFNRIRPQNGVVLYKGKAIGKASPFLRMLDRSVFDIHKKQQNKLQKILQESQNLNLSKNSIPTLAVEWLKFNLGDTMRIIIYHQERHYVQIDNLVHKRED